MAHRTDLPGKKRGRKEGAWQGDEDDDDDDRSICVQMAECGQEGAIFPDLSGECVVGKMALSK